MCGMPVLIRPTSGFERKYVWYGLQLGQFVILSLAMCGMPVIIWSNGGFESKYVWYGRYNLVNLLF